MNAFKLTMSIVNVENSSNTFYFKEKRTVDAFIEIFNDMLTKGNTIEWKCEEVQIMDNNESIILGHDEIGSMLYLVLGQNLSFRNN